MCTYVNIKRNKKKKKKKEYSSPERIDDPVGPSEKAPPVINLSLSPLVPKH